MQIKKVTRENFAQYGRILDEYDFTGLLKEMEKTPCPMDDVIYIPSVEELETLPGMPAELCKLYGNLPAQIGYCNGFNKKLNAVEYHRSSEIDIAVNDLVLLLGRQQDIEQDYTYDTSKIEAFLVPAGVAVELYATTLHYAPCSVGNDGFRCVVILPKDTNTELEYTIAETGEDSLITAKNKWLIAHADAQIEGAFVGLKGENITIE